MSYWNELEKSDLWLGKIHLINSSGHLASVGDTITRAYCPRCKTYILPKYVLSKYDGRPEEVISANCGICT